MVELADTQDLGSCAHKRAGSTPVTRTTTTGLLFQSPVLFFIADFHIIEFFLTFCGGIGYTVIRSLTDLRLGRFAVGILHQQGFGRLLF